jgi:pyrroloquinoline quinone (PQQ) biosynthesis protein C
MAQETFSKENLNFHAQANRETDYRKIIHPMLVELQLGRITQEQLQAAVAEIDAKYPFATEDLVVDMDTIGSVNINQGA